MTVKSMRYSACPENVTARPAGASQPLLPGRASATVGLCKEPAFPFSSVLTRRSSGNVWSVCWPMPASRLPGKCSGATRNLARRFGARSPWPASLPAAGPWWCAGPRTCRRNSGPSWLRRSKALTTRSGRFSAWKALLTAKAGRNSPRDWPSSRISRWRKNANGCSSRRA